MADHEDIYRYEAAQYELLISREDYEHNIIQKIAELVPNLATRDVIDIGAGTGRLTGLLAPHVKSIISTDESKAMLDVAETKLQAMGMTNWKTVVADHRSLPIPDHSADLIAAGWTICYLASSNVDSWKENLEAIMQELRRVVRPSGTAIIFENFGTGGAHPNPPDFLKPYYAMLENHYGFSHSYIRTDYQFASSQEAERLTRFFFGDGLADQVISQNSAIVPECTGVWWQTFE